MEKRVLLAFVLSVIVLYGFQALFPPPKPRPAEGQGPGPAAAGAGQQSAEAGTPGSPVPASPKPALPETAPASPASSAQPLIGDGQERDVVVENDAVRAVFSNRGAVLKSWRLKRYFADNGSPLDLVPERAPAGSPRPFTLTVDDEAVNATLARAIYQTSEDALKATGAGPLTFEYRDSSGIQVRKVFEFPGDQPYVILFSTEVNGPAGALNPAVAWGPALGTGVVSSGLTYSPSPQPIFNRDGDVHRIGFGDIAEYRSVEGSLGFAGVDDHYFLTALIPPPQAVRVQYDAVPVGVEGSERGLQFVSWSVRLSGTPSKVRFFAGPKDFDVLRGLAPNMVEAIHFGWYAALVVPLLRALKWVNGYVGNYGWSIIVLTVLINLAMFPLRHKSVVSMRKMQELQPELKAIQDRYAKLKMGDPARQKMNVELMNLYRERGVNPASGCVPMLLTLPVLLAFYSMLSVAIELRGAPFIGWIKDLSVYDPWFVTPVLMGATQFIQTKMTPATGDPQQQKIMLFMPLIFMIFFIWAPSGLVLYWTVSNLWAIGQQVVTNRLIGAPRQRTVRPAAERQLKAAGRGKSDAARERK
jgi:YidC/Oxa1 family membrane protein insertase